MGRACRPLRAGSLSRMRVVPVFSLALLRWLQAPHLGNPGFPCCWDLI